MISLRLGVLCARKRTSLQLAPTPHLVVLATVVYYIGVDLHSWDFLVRFPCGLLVAVLPPGSELVEPQLLWSLFCLT